MIQITYNGIDITDNVSVNRCFHDMYAADRSDTLNLRVNDVDGLWDAWQPSVGDEIRVDYGSIGTGTMFLRSATPQNGTYDLVAQAAPASGFVPQYKSWSMVRLFQVCDEIAARNGLTFVSYGVDDRLYSYLLQDGVGDLPFLARRARLEGDALLVHDKKLILYSETFMEAVEPSEVLDVTADGEYQYTDRRSNLYGSCVIDCGVYSGKFSVDNGSSRVLRPDVLDSIGSNDEARRFAKNLLRHANKNCYGGFVRSRILPGYAAGSTVALSNARAASWDGPVFLDHVRNDYGREQSKVFFRKPLEGY